MRWIQTSRVSLQRLGTLLAVATVATESRRTSVEALGRASSQLLTKEIVVADDQSRDVAAYVRRMHLWQRYEGLRGLSTKELAGKVIQAQDLWLADPRVPSASGAITERVTDEPAQLAVGLRLIRSHNHTLTDRGRALRLSCEPEVRALTAGLVDRAGTNPMLLSAGSGLILLRAFLEADYDFVRATHEVAVQGSTAFSRADISARMGDVCRRLRDEYRGKVRSGEDRQKLSRLKDLADSIDSAGNAPTRGGARPPDQTSTVRLEPYVDLGLITRVSRFDYNYALSDGQAAFFSSVAAEPTMETWAEATMVGVYCQSRNLGLAPIEPLDYLGELRNGWQDLRSQMGYASIDEALLLVNARLIDSQQGYFELGAGREALRELHKRTPKAIRFTMARGGAVSYFKLSEIGTGE
jgi:hypothetical protein